MLFLNYHETVMAKQILSKSEQAGFRLIKAENCIAYGLKTKPCESPEIGLLEENSFNIEKQFRYTRHLPESAKPSQGTLLLTSLLRN